ncbi:hypothetical protein AAZX31_07G075100 [Glycine max]
MTSLIGPQQHFKVCFGESSSHQEMDINVIGIPPPTKKNSASNSMKQKKVWDES